MGSSSNSMLHLGLLLRFYIDHNYSTYGAEFRQIPPFFFFVAIFVVLTKLIFRKNQSMSLIQSCVTNFSFMVAKMYKTIVNLSLVIVRRISGSWMVVSPYFFVTAR